MTEAESEATFARIFGGQTPDQEIRELLVELHQRGETVAEITGAVRAARQAQRPLFRAAEGVIDTCGTGGDGLSTFNVSTAVALAAAAMGVPVIKHGNRAQTSRSGSADVLEALGLSLSVPPGELEARLALHGFIFVFAPDFHPGFGRVGPIRKALPHRTVFNLLGPLLNPAAVGRQVIGVFSPSWIEPIARVLVRLGHRRALVVHGGGTDELSSWGENHWAEVDAGRVTLARATPAELGVVEGDVGRVAGGSAAENAALIRAVLRGAGPAAATELVALNLAAALWAAGRGARFVDNLPAARAFLVSGRATEWLSALAEDQPEPVQADEGEETGQR